MIFQPNPEKLGPYIIIINNNNNGRYYVAITMDRAQGTHGLISLYGVVQSDKRHDPSTGDTETGTEGNNG